jgi:hypothetical protein
LLQVLVIAPSLGKEWHAMSGDRASNQLRKIIESCRRGEIRTGAGWCWSRTIHQQRPRPGEKGYCHLRLNSDHTFKLWSDCSHRLFC